MCEPVWFLQGFVAAASVVAGSRFSLRICSLVTALFSFSLPEVPPQFVHLSKKNRERGGGGKNPNQHHKAQRIPALGLFKRLSLAALAILTGGNDLTWRSPRPAAARGLGPRRGERGPGADLPFPAAFGRRPPAPPARDGAGMLLARPARGRAREGWLFTASPHTPYTEQGN